MNPLLMPDFKAWLILLKGILLVGLSLGVCKLSYEGWKWAYRTWVSPLRDFITRVDTGLRDVKGLRTDVSRLAAITRAEAERSPSARAEFSNGSVLEFANAAFLRILGLAEEEAVGLGWLYALPASTRDAVQEQVESAAKDARVVRIHVVIQNSSTNGISAILSMFPLCSGLVDKDSGFWAYLDVIETPVTI